MGVTRYLLPFLVVGGVFSFGSSNAYAVIVLSAFLVLAYSDWAGQGWPRLRPFHPSPDLGPERPERAE